MYKIYIALNTDSEIEEFVNICSQIPSETIVHGKDENGSEWMLSAKSMLCSLVMKANLQRNRKFNAHKVDWSTIYVECEDDIFTKISKFAI